MAKSFDIKVLPIYQKDDEVLPDMPGLHVVTPPNRAARRRSAEQLILHLSVVGNAPLTPKAADQILRKLSQEFYQTEGSTTSALRKVAEVLNQYLHDRNLRGSSRGVRGVGILTQFVFRGDRLIFAQSGSSHVYLISPERVKELHDTDLAGPGLGAGRVAKVRYYQEKLAPRDMILVTPQPPAAWSSATVKNLYRMRLESIYHRLLHRVEVDLNALLLAPEKGTGNITVLRPVYEDQMSGEELDIEPVREEEPSKKSAIPSIPDLLSPIRPGPTKDRAPETDPGTGPEPEPGSAPEPVPEPESEVEPGPAPKPETELVDQAPAEKRDLKQEREQAHPAQAYGAKGKGLITKTLELPIWSLIGDVFRGVGSGLQVVWESARTLLGRMLPDERYLDFPSWVLGLIAVVIPVIIVSFGSVMYIKRGRNTLYQSSLQEAQQLVQVAENADSPQEQYQSLAAAFESVQQARRYRQTEEVEELFNQVRSELDSLDRITRLDYEPLFSHGLGPDVNISEIVVTTWNDLYMLNERDGTVIWAQSNADGYEIKEEFHCGPISGHKTVGPLVDIVPLASTQEDEATILGIDRTHTMIFCYPDPGESPVMFEDTSYTLQRGPVKAMTISSNSPRNIYILDPEKRAIWIEFQSQNYHEGSEYFGAIDSPPMEDAIDLATNGSELYLLHADGYMSKCVTEGPNSDPQCKTPLEYDDPRQGRESGPFIAGANFSSIKFKGSPGMAIYMLDPGERAVYRFSTQMEYQRQYRPDEGLVAGDATAFTVTMSDRVYLAVGSQVYTAQLIP